jgi:hypothetical protein
VAVTDLQVVSLGASAEHPTDRTRDANSGRIGMVANEAVDDKEADRMASEGALSAAAVYLNGGSSDLTAARGSLAQDATMAESHMRTIQYFPRSLTSTKGRSFRLSYAEIARLPQGPQDG